MFLSALADINTRFIIVYERNAKMAMVGETMGQRSWRITGTNR